MAKAKINANQVKSVAGRAGAPVPPAPRIQSPDQLKKQAQQRAKARVKSMIRIAMFALTIAIIGLIVYFVKFYGRMPKDALKTAINYAYENNEIKFRQSFTTDSIKMVDNGNENNSEPWRNLMESISPAGDRPKILSEKIEEKNNKKLAEVKIKLDGDERTVYMRQEDGKWRINLNVAIDPRHLTLPSDIPADYKDNFDLNDEPEAWWEEPPEEEGKKKGFLSKFKCGGGRR